MHRTRFFTALIVLAVVAVAGLARTAPVRAASGPIRIEHCFVTEPKPFSKQASGTQIVWVNEGSKTAKAVTFGVGYRNSASHFYRKVTDDGTFAPGTTITHHYALFNDVTYAGKQTTSCSALSVKWSDGTTWIAH
jgi:hypothetical protein